MGIHHRVRLPRIGQTSSLPTIFAMHRRVTKYMEIVSKKEDISLTSVMENGSRGRSPAPQRGDPAAVSAGLHTGDF